jgi:hypothetical protein
MSEFHGCLLWGGVKAVYMPPSEKLLITPSDSIWRPVPNWL